MECTLEMLRTQLTQILDESPPTFRKIGEQSKYVDGSLMILYLKRDHAKQRLGDVVQSVQQQLSQLQKQMSRKIDAAVAVKEQKLKQEKESMMKHVRSTAAGIYQIEGILEIGQEAKLAEHGPKLLEELQELLKWDLKSERLDINHLEFISNTDLFTKILNDPTLFGYVQTSPHLNPATVRIANKDGFFIEKAFCGIEEIVIISVGDKCVEGAAGNLQVVVRDKTKKDLPTVVKDNKDGTFTARFTPVQPGFHTLSIKLYATHIPDSPYNIMVLESPADVGLDLDDGSKDLKCKKRTISRLAIDAVKKHITDNPPVKEHISPTEKISPGTTNTNSWNSLGLSPSKSPSKSYNKRHSSESEAAPETRVNRVDGANSQLNTRPGAEVGGYYRAEASPTSRDILRNMADPIKRYTRREPEVPPNTPSDFFVDKNNKLRFPWEGVGESRISPKPILSLSGDKVSNAQAAKPQIAAKVTFSTTPVPPSTAIQKPPMKDTAFNSNKVPAEKQNLSEKTTPPIQTPPMKDTAFNSNKVPAEKQNVSEKTTSKGQNLVKDTTVKSDKVLAEKQNVSDKKTMKTEEKFPASNMRKPFQVGQHVQKEKTCDNPQKLPGLTGNALNKEEGNKENTTDSSRSMPPSSGDRCFRGRRSPFGRTLQRNQSHTSTSHAAPNIGKEDNWEDNWESLSPATLSPVKAENPSIKPSTGMDKNNNFDNIKPKDRANDQPSTKTSGRPEDGGKVTDSSAHLLKVTSPLEEHIRKKNNTDISAELVRQIGHRGSGIGGLRFPLGVTVSPNKDIIVCDNGNSMVKVFSWEGKQKFTIGTEDGRCFRRPSAVVCNDAGDIFVKDDYCIKVFDKTGSLLRQFGERKLNRPYGLILNQKGELVLIDHERYGMSVVVYSQDGRLIKRAKYQPSENPSWRGAKCRFIHSMDNLLYVVDLGKSCVYVTNYEGEDIKVIGSPGGALGQFNEPSGITGDNQGNLLIADSRNNRIQLYQTKGDKKFQCFVNVPTGILRPSDIHLTSDGHLCVVNYIEHCVKVFKITGGQ